jgi:hypothetical protein
MEAVTSALIPRIHTPKVTLPPPMGSTKPATNFLESAARYGRKLQEVAITQAFCFGFDLDHGDLLSFRLRAVSTNQTGKLRYT